MKVRDAAYYAYATHQAYSGDPIPAVQAVGSLLTKSKKNKSGMAPKRNKKPRRVRRRIKRAPGALKVSKLNLRHVVLYEGTEGSQHRWYYQIKKSWLCSTFTSTFDEFKVLSIRVRYVPNNATNETGLYASVLLDREGFGNWGSSTAIQWFPTLGAMPGCRIRPRYAPTTHVWRPTEPTVRDWCRYNQDITYCTVYVCNNGKENEELGGLFEVSATFLARGIYYNAKVKALQEHIMNTSRPSTPPFASCPSPTPSTASSCVIGGFITLKME